MSSYNNNIYELNDITLRLRGGDGVLRGSSVDIRLSGLSGI